MNSAEKDTALTWRFVAVATAALLAVMVLAFLGSDLLGRSARRPVRVAGTPPAVVSVDSGPEVVRVLQEAGAKGSHLLQVSTRFGLETTSLGSAVSTEAGRGQIYPPPVVDAAEVMLGTMGARDYLWVATRIGLVRRVTHVVPPDLLKKLRDDALAAAEPGLSSGSTFVSVNTNGEVRRFYSQVPRIDEGVVLLVNASYFTGQDPAELIEQLEDARVQPVLVIVSTDQDRSDVTQGARSAAREFAELAEEGWR